MAKLQSDNLILEIRFNSFEEQWVAYEIKFYWKDEIIVNDSILKRTGWWGKRSHGTFLANDYEKDLLIETLRKVLETNKPDYWEPVEPDVKIAIYPEMFFPFLKSHWILIDEGTNEEIEQRENEKKEEGKHPEDLFTIIIFIDSYNFKNCEYYSGEGISLHMIITRKDLEKFVTELETEYNSYNRIAKNNS